MQPSEQTCNDKQVPLMTRLPACLHSWVKEQAKKEHRSLNAMVIVMLQRMKEAEGADCPDARH